MFHKPAALVVAAFAVALLLSLAEPRPASGATFTVTKTADTADGVCDTDCSLREAITAANSAPGLDTIAFNIPPAGPHTIVLSSALPTINGPVMIDGATQPGYAGRPIIELHPLDPSSFFSSGLVVSANGDITIRGLVINRFPMHGISVSGSGPGHVVIENNFIGTDLTGSVGLGNNFDGVHGGVALSATITIGGTTEAARNLISGNRGFGITFNSSSYGAIQGNLIGTDITGTKDLGNYQDGVQVGGNILIGGASAGARNVISGNDRFGISVLSPSQVNIQGNYIGTDITGSRALGNRDRGINLVFSRDTVVGGADPSVRNVISGNGGPGVLVDNRNFGGNQVQGNFIGTAADGVNPLGNGADGVEIPADSRGNTVMGNVIAHNARSGVLVGSTTSNQSCCNLISSNSIFANGSLGIDLTSHFGPDGVAPNDSGDVDVGGNLFQNFPVLTSVNSAGGNTQIQGTLSSTPNTEFRLEFFSGANCDPSGHGEGQELLGASMLPTNASGEATFSLTFPVSIPGGRVVTATATDPANNTSEFSRWMEVPGGNRDCDEDGFHDVTEGQCAGSLDDDNNGFVNDGCPQVGALAETDSQCTGSFDEDFDGWVNDGCPGAETLACGSNAFSFGSRPERIDTAGDDDGDSLVNEALPPGSGAYDCDGDGFSGQVEQYVFSAANTASDQKPCGTDAWPADIDNDGFSDISDLSPLSGRFGEAVPPAPARYNIAPEPPSNGFVDISDISRISAYFGQGCG